jgi:UDP-N-acetylglucosamine transferase subunit ALG13
VTATADLAPRPQDRPRVVVTVGTDHHPFDRLITWTNDWLGTHPEQAPGFFVQWGTASVVPACPGERFLDVERLDGELGAADVIVSHGGPATIAAAWARGLLPIVVPRVPRLGEHVDDHQVSFAVRLAELGRVRLAQTPAEFTGALAEAASDHARLRADVPPADVDAAVARFGELVEDLVSRPRHRLPWRARRTQAPTNS